MSIMINSREMFDLQYIKNIQPDYFKGCTTNMSRIISKKSIPKTDFMFASYSKLKGWKELEYDTCYNKKRVLISKSWVESNIFKSNSKEYTPLPPLLKLSDSEKFVDLDGKTVEITVRGERDIDKIYFKTHDIGCMLNSKNIRSTLTGDASKFLKDTHYTYFLEDGKIIMYLTYYGLVRLLFVSTLRAAEHFQTWAFNVLFKAHMGTPEDKIQLSADVLGLDIKTIRSFLQTAAAPLPTIYLLELGKVKDLRYIFTIPDQFQDTDTVVKFGLTNDLSRRLSEHEKMYNKLKVSNIKLKFHAYIDNVYLYEAEKEVADYFRNVNWNLEHIKYNELACISDIMIDNVVHGLFKNIGQMYSGKLHDLQVQIQALASEKVQFEMRFKEREEYINLQNDMIQILKSKYYNNN